MVYLCYWCKRDVDVMEERSFKQLYNHKIENQFCFTESVNFVALALNPIKPMEF